MLRNVTFTLAMISCLTLSAQQTRKIESVINLAGKWRFAVDPRDEGDDKHWSSTQLKGTIRLPGSMTENHLGNEVDIHTPWVGGIADSSYFKSPVYAKYRQPGNIKIPFWLQPEKYYKGAAWYQKTVTIPSNWIKKSVSLIIERPHWQTKLWINGEEIGTCNSLGAPHQYELKQHVKAGTNTITIRVDNSIHDVDPGENSHSISDHTQSNWNGMVGKIFLQAKAPIHINDIKILSNIHDKSIESTIEIMNTLNRSHNAEIALAVRPVGTSQEKMKSTSKSLLLKPGKNMVDLRYILGTNAKLWSEFDPHLYTLTATLKSNQGIDSSQVRFGLRKFASKGTQFTINDKVTFLRGTLECAIFPKTGYPPTDKASWLRIFTIARSFGLNHIRFHSWTPPEAAFDAADETGLYLQVECSSWANQGSSIGDGRPIDKYLYEESERIVKAYGNHPSFCMMTYGNEPAGKNQAKYLANFEKYWKAKDSRRLYTSAAGWPVIPESDYDNIPNPRIQGWGEGLQSIINSQPPRTDYDWRKTITASSRPTVGHEVGQWCVYPDLKEMKKYTGVLKARNFEIFEDRLKENGLSALADSFLLASGKLQALCYKADIEAALRTPGYAGFQLLDLHDFPGQGSALVGVLNPFWEEKGYVSAAEFKRFSGEMVPLARFPKMVYLNDETLNISCEVSNFADKPLSNCPVSWVITNNKGESVQQGDLGRMTIARGNNIELGKVTFPLREIKTASQLTFNLKVGDHLNSWKFYVYPAEVRTPSESVLVTQEINEEVTKKLANGGKVLLTLKKGSIKKEAGGDIAVGFSSIFWNTAWTNGQPPHTLGVLCNPNHPALRDFPTSYHSDWQWWDAMSHSNAIRLDAVGSDIKPIVRIIDDWFKARSLAMVFECKVGSGKLIVSSVDLLTDSEKRPEARQLMYSLLQYMDGPDYKPSKEIPLSKISGLLK